MRDRLFRSANIVMAFGMASFLGLTFAMPLYLQSLRGLSPLDAGLTTFPQAVGILVSSQISGRMYPHVGPRRLIVGGMFAAGVVIFGFLFIDLDTGLWVIRGMMLLGGLGWVLRSLRCRRPASQNGPGDDGRASAIFSTPRRSRSPSASPSWRRSSSSFTTL